MEGGSDDSLPAAKGSDHASEEAKQAFVREWAPLSLTASSADYYFNSYNHYGVHEDVLKDGVTSYAFTRAVMQNAHLFRGKVVLDACAGLGVCALLAAQAGAKKVIAIESQPELAMMGTAIARKNGFGADVLEYVVGRPDAIEDLPGGLKEVDIILSNWLGYFMLYEARIADVLKARDRWLRPGGLLFPDKAKMYMAMLEDPAYKQAHFDFYGDVWGFDFSPMQVPAHSEPVVSTFGQKQVLSSSACILDLDLYKCSQDDCFQMASTFQVACSRSAKVNAVMTWFEIRFDACHKPIAFDTGPTSPMTCWKQTIFFLSGSPLAVKAGDKVRGMFAVRKGFEERRNLDIKIACRVNAGKLETHLYRWS